MSASRRSYTDEYVAEALVRLAANGGKVRQTARELDIHEATLRHWRNGDRAGDTRDLAAHKMRPAADRLDYLAAYLLDLIPDRTGKMNAQQLAVAAAVLMDKAAMLRAAVPADEGDRDDDWDILSGDEKDAIERIISTARKRARQPHPIPGTDGD